MEDRRASPAGDSTSTFPARERLTAMLRSCVRFSVELVDACDAAGATFSRGGQVLTGVGSNEAVEELDSFQFWSGEGPCNDSMALREVQRIDAMSDDIEWPNFSQRAVAKGMRSIMSWPMIDGDDVVGSLNLYSFSERAFSGEQVDLVAKYVPVLVAALSTVGPEADLLEDVARRRSGFSEAGSTGNVSAG